MTKAKKKPLLVGFTEDEHAFVEEVANKKGLTKTAYIRMLISQMMKKK